MLRPASGGIRATSLSPVPMRQRSRTPSSDCSTWMRLPPEHRAARKARPGSKRLPPVADCMSRPPRVPPSLSGHPISKMRL